MSRIAKRQSFDKIHSLLFVASVTAQVSEPMRDSSLHSAISISKVPSHESTWKHRRCAGQFVDQHHQKDRHKTSPRGSEGRKRDKPPRLKKIGCGGWI